MPTPPVSKSTKKPSLLKDKIVQNRVMGKKYVKPTREPVWTGPCDNEPKGGITQSMMSDFLACRERFRLRVIEGLDVMDTFSHRLEYGNMWHICEEELAKGELGTKGANGTGWIRALNQYCKDLCLQYRHQQDQVNHWYNVCKTQFPIYVRYWAKHPDVKERTPLLQEGVFCVPYELPSGRSVFLRGKWDSVDLIGKAKSAGIYLQENKTKAQIKEALLKKQLGFDLQTMVYVVALREEQKNIRDQLKPDGSKGPIVDLASHSIKGIRYNVVVRPLSGGKGSIVRHKAKGTKPEESPEAFYKRLQGIIEDSPQDFFMRWKIELTQQDIERFEREFLRPFLEELCDWWNWVSSPAGRKNPFSEHIHYRLPYGIYNPIAEGGATDLDEYLLSGSELGLTFGKPLFPELQ